MIIGSIIQMIFFIDFFFLKKVIINWTLIGILLPRKINMKLMGQNVTKPNTTYNTLLK